jgi:hypothetical protein
MLEFRNSEFMRAVPVQNAAGRGNGKEDCNALCLVG